MFVPLFCDPFVGVVAGRLILAKPRVLQRLCSLLHLAMGKMWLARLIPPGRRFNEEASSGSWVSGSANIPRLGPYSTIWTTFPDLDMEFDAFATTYPRGMSSPGPRFS